ncbi:hypothetical protein HFU84_11500 [Acidithiobacillus sp. CV18-2]|uniref:Restriction endonuclease domain-containing protein n=1 Tax=Igneacidithiobacillus copahuensis TaxID=2724909 RepID=A0AAE2YMV8_9PROT|nr:hypothetical protein [Igneacidithiobacillus copahuensis]MBU2754232.1 hypothetical protein [Acidithiobacillus sp. CV18-3]MBU2755919.1 hypothetical protein [Acidithiobacillus sp. BN09-2]MBU2778119.1 hypothetical protein [Acidithiobacillus sp. CV18-2]MBU2796529.1 hypothetical protein [Acidithiobacillus sp. VAN18-2]MBU2800155.1 hypothetical protein [Acidithiobacillus sp. VAN18-4]
MSTAKRLARYEDLLNLPDNLVGEIIAGRLLTSPRPAPKHARASSVLGIRIGNPFDLGGGGGPGGWWILDEPELHLGTDILVPDLAGWRREHLPTCSQKSVRRNTAAPDTGFRFSRLFGRIDVHNV